MAKGSNDIILRDRLQFETSSIGNVALVYGRIDLSDYVSIPEAKGLAIKEIRFQFRTPSTTQVFPIWLNSEDATGYPAQQASQASIVAFATTTAYENAQDIGIASPNVIAYHELQSVVHTSNATDFDVFDTKNADTERLTFILKVMMLLRTCLLEYMVEHCQTVCLKTKPWKSMLCLLLSLRKSQTKT